MNDLIICYSLISGYLISYHCFIQFHYTPLPPIETINLWRHSTELYVFIVILVLLGRDNVTICSACKWRRQLLLRPPSWIQTTANLECYKKVRRNFEGEAIIDHDSAQLQRDKKTMQYIKNLVQLAKFSQIFVN